MQANATWKQEMTFDALSHSGHTVVFDGDPAHTHGASPMETVLMGLCGCTAIDVISILKKARAFHRAHGFCGSGAGIRGAKSLYTCQIDLSSQRRCLAESDGRCRAPLRNKILFRGCDDIEDRQDRVFD